jgi:hypothetical protein
MSNSNTDPIAKVDITGVAKNPDELEDSQLDQVSGGGGYGCPACGSNPCGCGS